MSTQISDQDPLAEVIGRSRRIWNDDRERARSLPDLTTHITFAVRAAGYKSPEEIAAVLDALYEDWKWLSDTRGYFAGHHMDELRAALLGTTEETTDG